MPNANICMPNDNIFPWLFQGISVSSTNLQQILLTTLRTLVGIVLRLNKLCKNSCVLEPVGYARALPFMTDHLVCHKTQQTGPICLKAGMENFPVQRCAQWQKNLTRNVGSFFCFVWGGGGWCMQCGAPLFPAF